MRNSKRGQNALLSSNDQVSKRSNNFVYERGASKKIKQKLAEDSMTEYSEDDRRDGLNS